MFEPRFKNGEGWKIGWGTARHFSGPKNKQKKTQKRHGKM